MDMKKNTLNNPLISVIMPVYNAGGFLVEAIESIVKQTYKNIELIMINDASTDDSYSAMLKYKRAYPKVIKIINLAHNLNRGGDSCANLGIKAAEGSFIAKMDADDIAHPQRLEKQVKFLLNNPDIFLVGSNAHVIDQHGAIVGEKEEPITPEAILKESIYFNPIIHPTVMFRNIPKLKKFYQIKYATANDYFTFFSLQCRGYKFANLPEKLLFYRIYGQNSSLKNIKKGLITNLIIKYDILKKYKYPLTAKAVFMNILYGLAGLILPQKVNLYLYLISKHIITLDSIKKSLIAPFQKLRLSIS